MKNSLICFLSFLLVCTPGYAQFVVSEDSIEHRQYATEAVDESMNDIVEIPFNEPYFNDSVTVAGFDSSKWNEIAGPLSYNEHEDTTRTNNYKMASSYEWRPSPVVKWILYILASLVVIFILFLVLKDKKGGFFRKKPMQVSTPEEVMEYDNVDLNSLDEMLKAALRSDKKKDIIRVRYLILIRDLAEKKHIRLKKEKTNRDYQLELAASPLHPDFREATFIYNSVWYGNIMPDEDQFTRIVNLFDALHVQINHGTA